MKAHLLILVSSLALWSAPAAARDMYWGELAVDARLDAQGHLHVSERHRMVFNGDWNGGERSFNVRDGQELVFESISRVSSDRSEKRLTEGTLRNVDEYAWFDPFVLRWRSRTPHDPSFDNAKLEYRIDYELIDILAADGEREFTLAHDFAFTERPGPIDHFRLHLELDPTWELEQPQPIELEKFAIPPGETVVLTLPLHYAGAQPPHPSTWLERRLRHLPPHLSLRFGLVIAMLVAAVGLWKWLGSRARARGHLEPLTPEESIDPAWLTRHVLAYKPEVVGAVYDKDIGEAEVAAVLARLELEGKVHSVVRPIVAGLKSSEMELELRVPRNELVGYERALIDRLFFAGDSTSTARIHEHYQSSGFNPATSLHALGGEVRSLLAAGGTSRDHLSCVGAVIGVLAVFGLNALLVQMLSTRNGWQPIPVHVATACGLFLFNVVGATLATRFRNDVSDPYAASRPLRGWVVFACLAFVPLMLTIPKLDPLGLVLFCALAVAVVAAILWLAAPQDYAAAIALRKHVSAARRYFERQLLEREPKLDDAWFPYLIALGLAPDIDAWFRAHRGDQPREGEPESERSSFSASSSTSTVSSEPSPGAAPSWSGGGGRFGGGGASGSWSSAAAGLASGVVAPSSGSSSGSSSSSSSSSVSSSSSDARSGGGGGGGW
jgi:uncharacterized membrane protein YgcG